MTTNAALLAEARKLDAEATKGPWYAHGDCGQFWISHEDEDDDLGPELITVRDAKFDDLRFAAHARTLLPQLADALEAALAARNDGWCDFNGKVVSVERLAAAEARLAKVRERAIKRDDPNNPKVLGTAVWCMLCNGAWRQIDPERHRLADCPARPMEPGT